MTQATPGRLRWKALVPLGLLFVVLAVLWHLFSDRIVRRSIEEAGTQVLGTQVDIGWLKLHEQAAAVELGELAIADPFDSTRNLFAVERVNVALDPGPLLEKKIIITDMRFEGISLFTGRDHPARPVPGGLAARTERTVNQWRERLGTPMLGFGVVDSIRNVVVDPSQLATVAAAEGMVGQADSLARRFTAGIDQLGLDSLVGEVSALTRRIAQSDPASLGLAGTRALVGDARSLTTRVDGAEQELARLDSLGRAGLVTLAEGVTDLDRARQADYRRVESMLGLPNLEGPELGTALFGQVSLSYLQRVLYWAELARQYLPPGLRPSPAPGPKRMRAAGTDVRFPQERQLPAFHIVRGEATSATASGSGAPHFGLSLANITSDPALVGLPAVARLIRQVDGQETLGFEAIIDHTGPVAHDSLVVRRSDVVLPTISLPGLPVSVDPGSGATSLGAVVEGDRFAVSLGLDARQVRWMADTVDTLPTGAAVLLRVLEGLDALGVEAQLGGTLSGLDQISIRSNVDDALAGALRAEAGEALAAGKARARAEVDRVTQPYLSAARSQVEAARAVVAVATSEWQARLAQVRQALEAEVRSKTGGLGGLIGR